MGDPIDSGYPVSYQPTDSPAFQRREWIGRPQGDGDFAQRAEKLLEHNDLREKGTWAKEEISIAPPEFSPDFHVRLYNHQIPQKALGPSNTHPESEGMAHKTA